MHSGASSEIQSNEVVAATSVKKREQAGTHLVAGGAAVSAPSTAPAS
jgi:hypothetical protein